MIHSNTEENYLKAIFNLSLETGFVGINELSQSLKIKMPTATSMMKKLADKKMVDYQSYKPLRLTARGRKAAALIIRKHRLTEMFLVEKMNFGWDEVHDIAEQIEHIQSPIFFDKMDELLNYPKFDPHGSPIPDREGNISPQNLRRLSDCMINSKVVLMAVVHSSDDFLKFLNSRDLKLGTEIILLSIEPFDGSLLIQYHETRQETLSAKVGELLLVK